MDHQTPDTGQTALLMRVARHIGENCASFTDLLFSSQRLTSWELEVFSRMFTNPEYPNDLIDKACSVALDQDTFSVLGLLYRISELEKDHKTG